MNDTNRNQQPPKGSPEEIATAHQWLRAVSAEFDMDPETIQHLVKDLLDLTKHVAHGPSRPAAPLTAFLVGMSVGKQLEGEESSGQEVALAKKKIEAVEQLLTRYSGRDS